MALPATATTGVNPFDPSDVLDYVVDFANILATGEQIASYVLTLSAEGVALGVAIGTGARAPALISSAQKIFLWLTDTPSPSVLTSFEGAGTSCGITATIVTNASPARTFERTVVLPLVQL